MSRISRVGSCAAEFPRDLFRDPPASSVSSFIPRRGDVESVSSLALLKSVTPPPDAIYVPIRRWEQEQLNLVIKYGAEDLFREELDDDGNEAASAAGSGGGGGGDNEKVILNRAREASAVLSHACTATLDWW